MLFSRWYLSSSLYKLPFPTIVACRNMLPFEIHELFKYRFSLMTLRLILLRYIYIWSYLMAHKIIFVSRTGLTNVVKILPGILSKSNIIYHGINQPSHDTPHPAPSGSDLFFLYVSIIDVYKGH